MSGEAGILMEENDEIHEEIDCCVDWNRIHSILTGNTPFGSGKKGAISG
jgi:hypothetical protein